MPGAFLILSYISSILDMFRFTMCVFCSHSPFFWRWSGQAKWWGSAIHPQMDSPMGVGNRGTPKWMPDEMRRYSQVNKLPTCALGVLDFDPQANQSCRKGRQQDEQQVTHQARQCSQHFCKMGSRNCCMMANGGDFAYDLDDMISLVYPNDMLVHNSLVQLCFLLNIILGNKASWT